MGKQAYEGRGRGQFWWLDPDEDLTIIGLDTDDGPDDDNVLYDERILIPLKESTVVNMMSIGVQKAIKVRKVKVDGAMRTEVVEGRRRTMHAREANKRLRAAGEKPIFVPCIIIDKGSDEHMSLVMISCNEHREDDEPIVRAKKAARMIGRGYDITEVANSFGVSNTAVSNWIKLLGCEPKVVKAVTEGKVTASAATALHGLEKKEQLKQLGKLIDTHKKTGKKATAKTARKNAGKGGSTARAPGKRILLKFANDEELTSGVDDGVIFGIKLAIGEHIPAEGSNLGKLLVKAGYQY